MVFHCKRNDVCLLSPFTFDFYVEGCICRKVIGAIHFAKTILEAILADINVAFASNKSLVCNKYLWLFITFVEKEYPKMAVLGFVFGNNL
jgi:hypothetical protein